MWSWVLIGLAAGLVMGALGVGGGAIVIFSLVTLVHMPQKVAQGTTLLVVAAPVSLLAAWRYYRQGYVDLRAGLTILLSFLVASYLGAVLGTRLPVQFLRPALGAALVLMGLKLLLL